MNEKTDRHDAELAEKRVLSRSKWKRYLFRLYDSFVQKFTPVVIQDLRPNNVMYFISGIVLLGYILSFSLFTAFSYENIYKTQYLVPAQSDLDQSGQVCSIQVKEVTQADFLIDTNGIYIGRKGFVYSESIYSIEFNNVAFDQSQFNSIMAQARSVIDELGQNFTKQTLNINLLYYLTWKLVTFVSYGSDAFFDDTKLYHQTFSLSADFVDIFTPMVDPWVFIMSRDSQCLVSRNAYFNEASAQMGFIVNALDYNKSSNCTNILSFGGLVGPYRDPEMYATLPSLNKNIDAHFDMRTYIVAHAVNIGVFNSVVCYGDIKNCLQQSQPPVSVGDFQIFYYVYPKFEGMVPVVCIQDVGEVDQFKLFCTAQFQQFYAVPIFNMNPAVNRNAEYEEQCNCSHVTDDCQKFNFFVSVLVYDVDAYQSTTYNDFYTYYPLYRFGSKYMGRYNQLLKDSFQAIYPRYPNSTDQFNGSYDFCYDDIADVYCHVVTFSVYSSTQYLNDYKRLLEYGGCNNTVSLSDAAWNNIYTNGPYDFNDNYASCHTSSSQAFVQATGISLANTFTYVPLFSIFIAGAYLCFLFFRSEDFNRHILHLYADDHDFSTSDRDEIVKMISNGVLKELYDRKYNQRMLLRKRNQSNADGKKTVVEGLADVVEREMSEEYATAAGYMSFTVENFGRMLDKDVFVKSKMKDVIDVDNPIMSDHSNDGDENVQMVNLAPGFLSAVS